MKSVSPPDIAIPAARVESAMADLLSHIRAVHDASVWLYCENRHPAAIYFAILCLEEISKHHMLDSRRRCGRGATADDLRSISHRKKILSFLHKMRGVSRMGEGDVGRKPPHSANYSLGAAKLNTMKKLAVYHEYIGGKTATLGGLLGGDGLLEASTRLQRIACQGLALIDPASCGRRGHGRLGRDLDACLVELMGLARDVPASLSSKEKTVLAEKSLGGALDGLERHIGELDCLAAGLHNGGHPEAAIFMYIMSFEEANKHYVIAKCRRRGEDVRRADMKRLRKHASKLSEFFMDVERFQKARNMDKSAKPTKKYHTVNPAALLRLDGLKKISMYFDYACARPVTLRHLNGSWPGGVSTYLDKVLRGMVSWIILSDGNSGDPYDVRATNRMHARRLKRYVDFKMDEENREYDELMYHAIGLLDCLSGAMGRRDHGLCEATLLEILEIAESTGQEGPP